ncbi:MAG: 16S rRNA (cytosine(1402)-N(4))-methyltransferase RsmH [Bacteroidota bacterium]
MAYHVPVLAHECVHYLQLRPGGIYVDATMGGGGHTQLILQSMGNMTDIKLFAFDQDEDALTNAPQDSRLTLIHANFRQLRNYLRLYGVSQIDGILADLGVSSHQFDQAERGFSFRFDAQLDMRMGQISDRTAADIVNQYSATDLQAVFSEYGEVRNAKTLAQAIIQAREIEPIETISQFLQTVDPWVRGQRNRYLAQVFQSLRIEVNDEMGALRELLTQCTELLAPKGRLVVLSYHSLEDRIVKNFLRYGNASGEQVKDEYGNIERPYRILTKKPILPEQAEIDQNPRARSAKLRVGEKI